MDLSFPTNQIAPDYPVPCGSLEIATAAAEAGFDRFEVGTLLPTWLTSSKK